MSDDVGKGNDRWRLKTSQASRTRREIGHSFLPEASEVACREAWISLSTRILTVARSLSGLVGPEAREGALDFVRGLFLATKGA